MSHHQLFSAFAQIGSAAANGKISAWFWGHEHTLTLYGPYRELGRGRCIGHGAIPVFTDPDQNDPRGHIVDPPPVDPVTLGANGDVYMHGFVILKLAADGSGTADYYQENNIRVWSEPL